MKKKERHGIKREKGRKNKQIRKERKDKTRRRNERIRGKNVRLDYTIFKNIRPYDLTKKRQ